MAWKSLRTTGSTRFACGIAVGLAAIGALTGAAPSLSVEQPTLRPAVSADPLPSTARWGVDAARQLVALIEASSAEGLNPRDYQLGLLKRSLGKGAGQQLDRVADAAALSLAHDYYFGRVGDRASMGWLIERSPYEAERLPEALQAAIQSNTLPAFFKGLLPDDARYAALREALTAAPEGGDRDRIRANLERARWMPRTAASNYIYVNVPSYRLQVVSDGQPTSTYTVVVGAKDTPTPQMISPTSSLVVNPWWNVPQSIVRSSNLRPGRSGFQFTGGAGNWTVRQPPGPRNALGRIKFNLVNDQAIYLHDTPAKAAFARDTRALSHGCVRVKDIDRLAAELMSDGGETDRLDDALAGSDTATLHLPQTWPVYLVYFTADLDDAGTLAVYRDIYGYDARIIAALDGSPIQMASR